MDHTENALRSVVKSLTDVIGPAINPTDVLAREQIKLVIDQIEFIRTHLDKIYGFERLKLKQGLSMGGALQRLCPPSVSPVVVELRAAMLKGEEAIATAGLPTAMLTAAADELAAAIRKLIRESKSFPDDVRRAIGRSVVDATDEWIALERSWYLPFGFDPDAGEVKELSALIP